MDPNMLYAVCKGCKGLREARRTCTRCFKSGFTPVCTVAEFVRMERIAASIDSIRELLVEGEPEPHAPATDDTSPPCTGPRLANTGTDDEDFDPLG